MGYTVDADNFEDSYYAKNSEGYKIDIRYDADDFELNVSFLLLEQIMKIKILRIQQMMIKR